MLAQILEFIDKLSIDERLHWRVSSINSREPGFDITWTRNNRPNPWILTRKGNANPQAFSTSEFEQGLKSAGVDLGDFERQVGVSVLIQAVFADMVTQSAVELFGSEVVTRSIRDTRAFLSEVSKMAHTYASGKPPGPAVHRERPKPQLRLINPKLH